jgi:hypothetical protein
MGQKIPNLVADIVDYLDRPSYDIETNARVILERCLSALNYGVAEPRPASGKVTDCCKCIGGTFYSPMHCLPEDVPPMKCHCACHAD